MIESPITLLMLCFIGLALGLGGFLFGGLLSHNLCCKNVERELADMRKGYERSLAGIQENANPAVNDVHADEWLSLVHRWLDADENRSRARFTMKEIMTEALGLNLRDVRPAHQFRLVPILHALGLKRARLPKDGGGREWCYLRSAGRAAAGH